MPDFNPLLFKSEKINSQHKQDVFMARLGDYLNQLQSTLSNAAFLARTLNGSGTIQESALTPVAIDKGTVTTSPQTIACDGATSISTRVALNAAINLALTLTHVPIGTPINILFQNTTVAAHTFFITATDPSGAAMNVFARNGFIVGGAAGTLTNMGVAGIAIAANGSLWLGGNSVPGNIFLGTS